MGLAMFYLIVLAAAVLAGCVLLLVTRRQGVE
jgi:hypothetical protein